MKQNLRALISFLKKVAVLRLYSRFLCGIIYISLGGSVAIAGMYSQEKLTASGVTLKDGMYHCEPLGIYVRPYDTNTDVEECAYALAAQKICSSNSHTRWKSGRCFCPEQNRYLDKNPRRESKIKRRKLNGSRAPAALESLAALVDRCTEFTPRTSPYGRSVTLAPHENGYVLQKTTSDGHWDNREDFPGEQGNPRFPVRIASILGLPLGFGYDVSGALIFPTFAGLIANLAKIDTDISFYETDGELTGRRYLEEFIAGRLPIAKIEDSGDATFFLHDLDFHMSILIFPKEIRELAQKQTDHLLAFIDYFTKQYPLEWQKPQFKLMMQRLIENQIARIDIATANLTQLLFALLKTQTSLSTFLENISRNSIEKITLHFFVMELTSDLRSVPDFLKSTLQLTFSAFEKNDKESEELYKNALFSYLRTKESEPDFISQMKIAKSHYFYWSNPARFGPSATDLFIERLCQLSSTSLPNSNW